MAITDQAIDQAYSDLRRTSGGQRNDYFALLYLIQEFGIERDIAIEQVAFGGNDYGVDGFHFDAEKRNFYLFQFKWSNSYEQFKPSFKRLTDFGMERIFGAQKQDQHQNQLLLQIKSCLLENEAIIDRVYIHFVFTGDPAEAERSQVLDKLREDLENKKYLIDQRFGRPVTMVIEFRSARTRKVGSAAHLRKTHSYPIELDATISREGPHGELMTVGFMRLTDLHAMHKEMGERFFERNIRAALPEDKAVNRSIQQSIKRIIIDGKESAKVFAFNHNGVTLFAEDLHQQNGAFKITEPRLLNGAQTVTTFGRFIKANEGNRKFSEHKEALDELRVMCRIITEATPDFVTNVTINNNRQNPVDPWNLHANDLIQLELQDRFRDELGIYYERQEQAFTNLSDEELEEQGITEHKALELTKIARAFLVVDGDIDKLARFREVFEDERIYNQLFNESRLRSDLRKIVLCYKIQFRLGRLSYDIVDKGANKYAYVLRSRNLLWALLCQAILNDQKLEERAEKFGRGLSLEAQYTEWLSTLATTRCRFILADLVADKAYAAKTAEGNFSFMRTNAAYKRAMEIAYKRWRWVEKRLK
ncbi:AIPR family protein [Bradyrhizobium sp.]|uniref:AIPR family protein n=1 Tax=Bradyrhizobium sp. TaxID=376 RepID=UPI002D6BCDE4|nr:AIPR family protein [Bradyrhizobium sp.]HZR75121.1 AIPR family protein [Bradyrhizobium sp.]